MARIRLLCFAMSFFMAMLSARVSAAELVLASAGASEYQVVLPDRTPNETIGQWLNQSARLVQAAFAANGFDVPIVAEADRDPARPGIYLGNTAFARAAGFDASQLTGWSYIHKAVGRDIVIAGNDHPPIDVVAEDLLPASWARRFMVFDRVGTVKGVCDFLRQYAGTRFLYRDLGPESPSVSDAPGVEFLETPTIAVPADLDVQHTPMIVYGSGGRRRNFYDIANNMFPRVATGVGGHTWDKAVTVEEHYEGHPEWFALIGGERQRTNQFCLSNPGFQERVYQWTAEWLRVGFKSVTILQPDGFRPCQCEDCHNLYGTGDDWSEKIWIFNRWIADRLSEEGLEGVLSCTAYGPAATPPNSFTVFPENMIVSVTGGHEEDFARWEHIEIPSGIRTGVHNWITNQGSRYTPMRDPLFLEKQVKRFRRHNVMSVGRDGIGVVWGLEGPAYYVWGRMFDDPENLRASSLLLEFVEAAFGNAAAPMRRFYDRLYQGIYLYANHLGTRDPAWTYTDIYGRRRKPITDPFQLIGFLYTPSLLETLDKELTLAEELADTDKIKARLALVRMEFEWVRELAQVVHLYHAHRMAPDNMAIRDALLDAIDARNETIDGYYDEPRPSGWRPPKPLPGWEVVLFPPVGHNAAHLRLEHNFYQNHWRDTPVNWDTEAMRAAPLAGEKQLAVYAASTPVALDDPRWERIGPVELAAVPGGPEPSRRTALRAAYDSENLYLRFESELPGALTDSAAAFDPEAGMSQQESLDVYLAPLPGQDIYYRFMVGPASDAKYDAASGLITDPMNLLYGRDDPSWTGEWRRETRLEPESERWLALVAIPFATLGVDSPEEGAAWRGNFGRVHSTASGRLERSIWSAGAATRSMDDRNAFGGIVFEPLSLRERLQRSREVHGRSEPPVEWAGLPNPLSLGEWRFRTDPMEQGVRNEWYAPDLEEDEWVPMPVPAWYAETDVGSYHGYAWYRARFHVPADWEGRTVRVLFAGVDEQAWVYVNGHLLREHTVEAEGRSIYDLYDRAFSADAPPETLAVGAENVLVVRVHCSVGQGGIWRPVFAHGTEQ